MAIDEINAKGGVMGKKLEPVVVDPASNWPLFAEKAKQLITQDKVAVTFGCWTSVSRKSVLPVFEELNSLLFYPVQYEGEELSQERVLHRRRAEPAGDSGGRIPDEQGRRRRQALGAAGHRLRVPAHHQQDPARLPEGQGREADADIVEKYTPFGHSDYQTIVADIKKFSAGGKTAVVSTINGDSNVPFYKELGNQGLKAKDVPVVAFSVGEEELRGVDTKPLVGHLAAWNYFMSIKNAGEHRVHQEVERLRQGQEHRRPQGQAADQRPDGGHLHRHQHVEAGGQEGQEHRHRQGDRGDGRPDLQGAVAASRRRWTRRTTTCTRACSSARSRPTASSTWCGRRRARSRPSRGATFIAENKGKKDEPVVMAARSKDGSDPASAERASSEAFCAGAGGSCGCAAPEQCLRIAAATARCRRRSRRRAAAKAATARRASRR